MSHSEVGGEPAITGMSGVLVKGLTREEAFSPGVEKRICRKNFGVCNAILRAKLADQL